MYNVDRSASGRTRMLKAKTLGVYHALNPAKNDYGGEKPKSGDTLLIRKIGDIEMCDKCVIASDGTFIRSKGNISSEGYTIGGTVTKDMDNSNYTDQFDPNNYQTQFFPGMADFIDSNIVVGDKDSGDRLNSSYWNDLGNDVFDDWGYFYIYDVESGKYYFPLINPQNQDDGVLSTQTFNVFDSTFTIVHGWTVQGIFKFDISVNTNKAFRFGAYGNMGSDGDEDIQALTQEFTLGGNNLNLYYLKHAESGDSNEILYSYFIPKNVAQNNSITYEFYNDSDDNNIMSKEFTNGLIVYFIKKNDVKDWIINDLELL